MELTQVIENLASRADDYLEGVSSREQARAAISEMITLDHAELSGADRARVIAGVMEILERESFFDSLHNPGDLEDDTPPLDE